MESIFMELSFSVDAEAKADGEFVLEIRFASLGKILFKSLGRNRKMKRRLEHDEFTNLVCCFQS
jgi:hypothetical protein